MFQHRKLPLELEEEPQQTKQGIRDSLQKARYRIWIEHSYFATFLRATKKIHWLRLLEMLYLTMTFKWEWMKVDIEILGSKATFFDPSGRNHPIEEGQGRIFKRWMRTGAPIARDQYSWLFLMLEEKA